MSAIILNAILSVYRFFRPLKPQIVFCYNQSLHHIYHTIFIAVELSNLQSKYEVVVYSTSRLSSEMIERELTAVPNKIKFTKLFHPGYNRRDYNVNWFVILCRLRMFRPKAVVVPDYYDNVFRQLLLKTFWIYVPHGPVNREFGSHPHIKDYDLVIFPGKNELDEQEQRMGKINNSVITGYSKFDYFYWHKAGISDLFPEQRPVILYNPHFEKQLSSYFDQGQELLETLSRAGKYNVIFMPHPDLARRYSRLIERAGRLPGVIIAQSRRINLDYMAASDLYITDVSSSVFEWLYFHKPALFFNTKKVDWRRNRYYISWALGKVVEDIEGMLVAIDRALRYPQEYQEQREAVFAHCFANKNENVSKLTAEIIWNKLQQ